MAEPLPEHGWQRLWHLMGLGSRTPEQHAELAELHEQAVAYVKDWEQDPEAAFNHLMVVTDRLAACIRHIAGVIPAAGALLPMVNQIDAAMAKAKAEFFPPPEPPELPPAPGEVEPAPELQPAPVVQAAPPAPEPEPQPPAPEPDHTEAAAPPPVEPIAEPEPPPPEPPAGEAVPGEDAPEPMPATDDTGVAPVGAVPPPATTPPPEASQP
jgi:hypothetical protein